MRRLGRLLLILALAAPPMPAIAAVLRQATQEMTVQRLTVVSGNGRDRHLDQLPDRMVSIELLVALAKALDGGLSPEGRER